MESSLLAWRETYANIISENGDPSPSMQCIAFTTACNQHSLTLEEFVAERKALNAPAVEVLSPTIVATLSDWDNSWETLQRICRLENVIPERLIVDYAITHQPLQQEVYDMFTASIAKWTYDNHKLAWYTLLTPEQSEQTITSAFATRDKYQTYLNRDSRKIIEHCVYNIKHQASPMFWYEFTSSFLQSFPPIELDSQRLACHALQYAPASEQRRFITNCQSRWEIMYRDEAPDRFAQWIANVIQYQPQYASIVLDGTMKKYARILQSPVISSNPVVIDYFLEHGIAKVSGSPQVRNILNALVHGKGNDALRERAWVKKLSLFGAKPSDVKKIQTWTPTMMHAFHYWIAASFQANSGKSPKHVYAHINKELTVEYKRGFNIDLRNPVGFQQWREQCQSKGNDAFAALLTNSVLCDTWEQGCSFYSANAVRPIVALPSINHELFFNDIDTFRA